MSKKLMMLIGDGFSDYEIQHAKNILQEAFKDWEDIVIMITNKEFKPKVVDDNAWEKMENDLNE